MSPSPTATPLPGADPRPRVLVVSGANLQLLGQREPEIYGHVTLEEIHARLVKLGAQEGVAVVCRQSNHEGDLVTWVGEAGHDGFQGVLLNPGGYTHTSVSLRDAVRGSGVPVVEAHLSNLDARESFRRKSMVSPVCVGKVSGFGASSYELGLLGLLAHLRA